MANFMTNDKDIIEYEGTVSKILPGSKFEIEIKDNLRLVVGHLSGKMRRKRITIMVGDLVTVEFSPHDLKQGRIISRKIK